MKRKVGKEPEGGSNCDLNKARLAYIAQLQKGKEMRLDEAAQAEHVRRSENDTKAF